MTRTLAERHAAASRESREPQEETPRREPVRREFTRSGAWYVADIDDLLSRPEVQRAYEVARDIVANRRR